MAIEKHIVRVLAAAAIAWSGSAMARADSQQEIVIPHLKRIFEDQAVAIPEGRVERPELYAQWSGLPPEERQQMRQQMREHWQNMPPPEQRGHRHESRERWMQMPSEERRRMRDEMREQRGGYGGRYGDQNFRR